MLYAIQMYYVPSVASSVVPVAFIPTQEGIFAECNRKLPPHNNLFIVIQQRFGSVLCSDTIDEAFLRDDNKIGQIEGFYLLLSSLFFFLLPSSFFLLPSSFFLLPSSFFFFLKYVCIDKFLRVLFGKINTLLTVQNIPKDSEANTTARCRCSDALLRSLLEYLGVGDSKLTTLKLWYALNSSTMPFFCVESSNLYIG
jgi:hypothetical protein